ncbi:hypothetical protein, partial [Enterobacter hormaechei]
IFSGCVSGVFSLCLSPLSRVWHRKRSQPRFSGAPNGCYGKSVSAADIKKPPGWRLAVIFVAFLHLSVFL